MRKVALAAICFIVLLLGSCGCNTYQATFPEKNRRAQMAEFENHTVFIEVDCKDSDGWGSGVILKSRVGVTTILTAGHVADPECTLTVHKYVGDKGYEAKIVKDRDDDPDLALLTIEATFNVSDVSFYENIYRGQKVIAVGYSTQLMDKRTPYLSDTDGVVATLDLPNKYIRFTADIYFGHSGGPVWDEETGKLVGIVDALHCAQTGGPCVPYAGYYYFVPAYLIDTI